MGKNHNHKINKHIALALGLATASSVFSGSFAYATGGNSGVNTPAITKGAEVGSEYFVKKPTINDTKLKLNIKKLKEKNQLATGDALLAEVSNPKDGKYTTTLIQAIEDSHIKDSYETVEIAGTNSRIVFRELTSGDTIKLFVQKKDKQKRVLVAETMVEGLKSTDPIVEVTKKKIMISSKMRGATKVYAFGQKDVYIIGTKKPENPKAISYDLEIATLKSKYEGKLGSKFIITHQESGKGTSNTKMYTIKDQYDTPNIEFIERTDKDHKAYIKVAFPDNMSMEPTPIQQNKAVLKVQRGSETAKEYTIDKAKMPEGIGLVNGGVAYDIPKDTPDGMVFKLTQSGKNFDDSNAVSHTYKVDMRYAKKLMEEFKTYPQEDQQRYKSIADVLKEEMEKPDRTQESLDQKATNFEGTVLSALRDPLREPRKKASDTVTALVYLPENRKNHFRTLILKGDSKDAIQGIVDEAIREDKKEEEKIKNEAKKKEAVDQFRQQTLKEIKALDQLTSEEQKEAEKELTAAQDIQTIAKISQKYRQKNAENSIKNSLIKVKAEYQEKLKALKDLKPEEMAQYEKEIEDANTSGKVLLAYNKAKDQNIKNNIEKQNQASLEIQKTDAIKRLDDLKFIINTKDEYVKRIKAAGTRDEITNIYTEAVKENKRIEAEELEKHREKSLNQINTFKYLSEKEKETARDSIQKAKDSNAISELLAKYNQLEAKNEQAVRVKQVEVKEKLNSLSDLEDSERKGFVSEVEQATTLDKLSDIEKRAEAKNEENKKKKNTVPGKKSIDEIKAEALKKLAEFKNLSEQQRDGYKSDIEEQSTEAAITQKLAEAEAKDEENLNKEKKEATEVVNKLNHLEEADRDKFNGQIGSAKTITEVKSILQQAVEKDKAAQGSQDDEKEKEFLEKTKQAAIENLKKLTYLSEAERNHFKEQMTNAQELNQVLELEQQANELNDKNKEKQEALDRVKKAALEEIATFTNLNAEEMAQAKKAISEATKVDDVAPIVTKYRELNKTKDADAQKAKALAEAKQQARQSIDKLLNLNEKDRTEAKAEIDAVLKAEDLAAIVEKYQKLDAEKAKAKKEMEKALNLVKDNGHKRIDELTHLTAEEQKEAKQAITEAQSIARVEEVVAQYKKLHDDREHARLALEAAKEAAIKDVDMLENLSGEERNKAKSEIQAEKSIDGVSQVISRYRDLNTQKGLEKMDLDSAKQSLTTLLREAKVVLEKLQPEAKAKLNQVITKAEEQLKSDQLDEVKAAIVDLTRAVSDAKNTLKPSAPKKESPLVPLQPSTPVPNKPNQPNQPAPANPEYDAAPLRPSFTKTEREYPATPLRGSFTKSDMTKNYKDLDGHWAREAINFALEGKLFDDIVKGNRFEPNKAMTRAEFIAILGRFEKASAFVANIPFKDVDMASYYGKYVSWAKNMGLIKGVDATRFNPNKTISREEMATILYRYKQLKKMNFTGEAKQFRDEKNIPNWAKEAVRELSKSKIINGMEDNTFNGKKQLSRAEIAQIVFNVNKIK